MSLPPLPVDCQWGMHAKEIRSHLCPSRQADLELLRGGGLWGEAAGCRPTLSSEPHSSQTLRFSL